MKKKAIKCKNCHCISRYTGVFPAKGCPWCGVPLITHLMGKNVNSGDKLERITITVPKDQLAQISEICKKYKVKRSVLIRTILSNTLQELT